MNDKLNKLFGIGNPDHVTKIILNGAWDLYGMAL